MLFYLSLTILSSTLLYVAFKFFERKQINSFHAIVVNYFAASACCFLAAKSNNMYFSPELWSYLPASVIIGLLFILTFTITSLSIKKSGLAATSVASKMSVVIPVAFGIWLYNEKLSLVQFIGIIIALIAVYFSGYTIKSKAEGSAISGIILPIIVFIGAGLVDSSIKFAQFTFMNSTNSYLVIMFMFLSAGIFGSCKLFFSYVSKREKIPLKSLLWGTLLGTVNYFSVYFLIKCFEVPGTQSGIVFALLNISVVLFSSLIALLLFKEKLNIKNLIGIALAVIAIVFLTH